jgi:transcriptional regulator with XRE-family HTH domain
VDVDIGESLAAARQARGLSLADVEALSAIRVQQLTALEEERFEQLPGRAYTRAFIRTYARTLELDSAPLLAEFDERHPAAPDLTVPPGARRGSRLPDVKKAAAGLVVAGLVMGFVWLGQTGGGTGPPRPASGQHAASAALPSLSSPYRPPDAITRAPSRPPAVRMLVIRAVSGPCWVEVRAGSDAGPLLLEKTLQPGELVRFRRPRLWVRLGAPSNVSVTRGGRAVSGTRAAGPVNLTA